MSDSLEGKPLLKMLVSIRESLLLTVEAINRYVAASVPFNIDSDLKAKIVDALGDDKGIMLIIEQPYSIKVKQRDWLSPEKFRQVAEKLSTVGAIWVTQGRDSHFRVPKVLGGVKDEGQNPN
ncbi:hypothetical protein MUP77_24500 [Candidatus Bathyarchaeota archaeon]|nr:hypothetical protein [Candidatus Bathyarchaeota archaeon]